MVKLIVDQISLCAGAQLLVSGASFSLAPGELVVVLGPNGAGKTSLLRGALGLARLDAGTVRLDGRDMATMAPTSRARLISYLPQTRKLAWPATVRDVVTLGRFAYGAPVGRPSEADRMAVTRALAACDLNALQARSIETLSGGEAARVHCARAFAAETPFLFADEPVAALDPRHQYRVMDLIADYVAQGGGALVVLHDVDLAARYASRLVWMKQGRIIADGPPPESLTAERLAAVYGVDAAIADGRVIINGAL